MLVGSNYCHNTNLKWSIEPADLTAMLMPSPGDPVPLTANTLLMMAYRSSVHESTKVSPNEMVFGRPIHLPIDLVLGVPDPCFP